MASPPQPPTKAPEEDKGPLFYDDIHRRVKELQPMVFDGIRLAISRPLSPHLQLSHTMTMGMMHSSYKFGANYLGTSKQISPVESYPVLASELQFDGTLNANLIHLITPRLKARFAGSFAKSQCTGSQLAFDYKGDQYTSTLTAANIDLIKNSGVIVGQLLHRVGKSLTIGPELVFQYTQQDSAFRHMSQLSFGGRLMRDKFHVDATVSPSGAHISYCQKANENLHFGAELLADGAMAHSNAAFYYQYDLPNSHTTFRGTIDTAWNVGAVIEKRFAPLPVTLMMSAVLVHPKSSTTVGLGLTLGQ